MKQQNKNARLSPKERKKTIVDAALEVFSSKGFRGATTKEIARVAGINEVTLFRYFKRKENLFSEVFEQHSLFPTLRGLIQEAHGESYQKVMVGLAVRFMEILKKRKDLIRLVLFEAYQYPDKGLMVFQQIHGKVFQSLRDYLREKQKLGEIRDVDPELAARAFLGMFFSFFVTQEFLLGKKVVQVSDERVIQEFVRIFLDGTQSQPKPKTTRR